MKIGMVNKVPIMKNFVLRTSHRDITHLAVITCQTNIKIDVLEVGERKRAKLCPLYKLKHFSW